MQHIFVTKFKTKVYIYEAENFWVFLALIPSEYDATLNFTLILINKKCQKPQKQV